MADAALSRNPLPAEDVADVVVVGGGSSGAVLAARLSEDPRRRVILLEAGGPATGNAISIPAAFAKLYKTEVDWDYETAPQPTLRGRTVYWPRGKVLGGSSSMNAMMWVRGFAADYDRWGELAGPGWSWSAMRPILDQVERHLGSTTGRISVEPQRSPSVHTATFLTAVREAGYPVETANRDQPDGFSQTMVSQHRGARSSTAVAYLDPARNRSNLDVRTRAQATRVVFAGNRATGVEYVHDGVRREVAARAEVVLCGGAVNTPQLLQLSGIGPAGRLRDLGLEVLVDRPEVGRNLRDHLVSALIPEVHGSTLLDATLPGQLLRYLTTRRGMLTSNVAEAYGFIRTRIDLELPDIELIFAPVAFVGEGLLPIPGHAVTLGPILLTPRSSGTIALASPDPLHKPVVDPCYLTDAEGADRAAMLAGFGIAERILRTNAFRGVLTGRYFAPAGGESMTPEERHTVALERHAHTLYHPVGTARMGLDPDSVVDPDLRVRGVDALRVADASVMPEIIRGHTNAPAIAIGERAAELIAATLRQAQGA